jgi:hypothetical protein
MVQAPVGVLGETSTKALCTCDAATSGDTAAAQALRQVLDDGPRVLASLREALDLHDISGCDSSLLSPHSR